MYILISNQWYYGEDVSSFDFNETGCPPSEIGVQHNDGFLFMASLVDELPGESEVMKDLRNQIQIASKTKVPILLFGEPGSGKDAVARLIHRLSNRRAQPFVGVNLAALPPNLILAELIGYTSGAFTGANRAKRGLFEMAHGGTIFLNEIDEASLDVQGALSSIIESGFVRRLGEEATRKLDIRVISATNQDLSALVESGTFRPDLFFRLSVIQIRIPSLQERRTEIPALAMNLLAKMSTAHKGDAFELAPDAIKALENYDFPGNFRELESILQRAALKAQGRYINANELGLPPTIKPSRRPFGAAQKLEMAQRHVDMLQREIETLRASSIMAQPIWQGRGFSTQHDYCFVLMPFGDMRDLQTIYHDHVKPVIERCGLRCERADDIYDVSGVMQSVWEGINKARIVIADLTERNANVFYELGIAHTLGKPVIMLSQSIDFVPFDLRHLRCIVYTYTPPGVKKLEQALERTIKTVLSTSVDLV